MLKRLVFVILFFACAYVASAEEAYYKQSLGFRIETVDTIVPLKVDYKLMLNSKYSIATSFGGGYKTAGATLRFGHNRFYQYVKKKSKNLVRNNFFYGVVLGMSAGDKSIYVHELYYTGISIGAETIIPVGDLNQGKSVSLFLSYDPIYVYSKLANNLSKQGFNLGSIAFGVRFNLNY